MLRIVGQIAKWILICLAAFILLTIHWILFVAFVVFLVWRGNVKRRRNYESHLQAQANYKYEHSEEFEVMGVTESNEDGKNRQDIFIRCYRGDKVTLLFNPTEIKPYAVEVWTKFGQIGYLAPYDVKMHIDFFMNAENMEGVIKKLTGGSEEKAELGCIIAVYITRNEQDELESK